MNQSDEIQLRLVNEADADVLMALRKTFHQTQVDAGLLDIPVTLEAGLARTNAAIIRGGRTQCVLAIDDAGNALGYIYFVLRTVPGMESGKVGSIEELFVDTSGQRRGLARRLVDDAVARMQTEDVDRIQTRVLAENGPAVGFWGAQGFAENVKILELPLAKG